MDPITHGLIGALTARLSASKTEHIKAALLCGAVAGMAPDLDVLIKSDTNPFLGLLYHRHFTHALLFAPIGAAIVAAFLWLLLFKRKAMPFLTVWLFCFAGFVVHGPVDATTAYGTHLYWPISNERVSWNNMAIIEPVVTFTALAAIIMSLMGAARRRVAYLAAFIVAYFGFGVLQNARVEAAMTKIAAERGHMPEKLTAMPTPLNLILWRSLYIHDGKMHYDAVRAWGDVRVHEGGAVPHLDMARDLPDVKPDSIQGKDIALFSFFADGYVGLVEGDKTRIGDYRYATLPNESGPMWGIKLTPELQDSQHAEFDRRGRKITSERWERFRGMIFGTQGGYITP